MASRILLLQLEDQLVNQLLPLFSQLGEVVTFKDRFGLTPDVTSIDLVLCPCEGRLLRAVVDSVAAQKPGLPVVAVGRWAETTAWLDALESGASDYCAPPMEPSQVRWLMDSHLGRVSRAAA
jgi:DNA-binding response OmpR family regulator